MELEVLAGGDTQGAVGPPPADVIVSDVRVRRHDPARNPCTDHQLVVLAEALGAGLLTPVPVVLLVDAVELEQGLRVVSERRRVLEELLSDEPSKMIARGLDRLVLRQSVQRREIREIRQMKCAS